MRLREDFVAVTVPATTANMGPGFDSMGMALNLWDDISVQAVTGPTSVEIEGEGAGDLPIGEDHLVVRALRAALDHVGAPQVGLRMHCTNRIPHSRGLGSSASAIVAGITLARALIGEEDVLTAPTVLDLATQMEGHPDNVAPAVFGGATVAWMNEEKGSRYASGAVRLDPPAIIAPTVFIPDFELSTTKARAALPASVPHADAAFNAGRAGLLGALLAGAPVPRAHDVLMEATRDRLHQEQRRGAMAPSLALVDWLRGAGYAAVVSGAGPTVISLEEVAADIRSDAVKAGWKVVPLTVARRGAFITRGSLASASESL